MIPAFSAGDVGDLGAQILGVVHTDRGDHGDRCVDDVGGVPSAAHADLDDGDVDRRVGERRERHRGDDLELAHRRAACRFGLLVDQLDERFDLAVGRDVLRRGDRLVVDRDALNGGLQMRAGGAAGAAVQGGQQRVDHARHRRLAVGACDVNGRVTALRRSEQFHQRGDARGARFELGLRPTLVQDVLDLE